MSSFDSRYDVVIVGGRPAGASLAARLGAKGLSVLVFDRAEHPSLPTVPSCPVVYPPAMHQLDKLGIDEAAYGDPSAKTRYAVLEFGDYFRTTLEVPEVLGRDYIYGIDRATLDHALWKNLARYPSVTARQRVAMTDLIRDDAGRVVGVVARDEAGGREERIGGACVVGADGRYSLVARKAGAKVTEEQIEKVSTVYYADWEGADPPDPDLGCAAHIFTTGRGTDVLSFPMPGGRYTFTTHERSDRVHVEGDAERYYEEVMKRRYPSVARRLAGARRVTPVVGMKRIANRYLEAGGPGWILTGDALHHKDPVDGQGINDAFLETEILAELLADHLAGRRGWGETVGAYERRVLEETRAMFLATMDRLRRELYEEPPELVIKTMIRWMVTDPEYKRRFVLFLCRAIPADRWLTRELMAGAIARGALADLKALWGRVRPAASSRA
jgi:2-polyprenyl-6-methoxyphenol hydroxylase-like FAD-dependent oxidoreductase